MRGQVRRPRGPAFAGPVRVRVDYTAGRDVEGVVDNFHRLHLNAVQFYDWMYRHARLLPPTDDFVDPLGRELSLATVRRLAMG